MTPLELPYETHPEFQFGAASLAIDPRLVEAFNQAYAQIEALGPSVPGADGRRLGEQAHGALAQLFGALRQAAEEPEMALFLDELARRADALLSEDLAHFLTRRRRRPLAGAGQRERLEALSSQRFVLERLSEGCLTELRAAAEAPLAEFRARAAAGRLTREDLSDNDSPTTRRLARALNAEFDRNGVNRLVSAYAGRPMRVTGLALELSVPSAGWWKSLYRLERPPLTLYAHTDQGLDTPKAIVYLCEVDETNGATSVYPGQEERLGLSPLQRVVGRVVGSVGDTPDSPLHGLYRKQYHQGFSSADFRRHFSRLPREMQYNSHFGWDVLPDSDLERSLVAAERKVTGPGGTFIVFDGARLLHRGGLMERGERLALQVTFGRAVSLAERVRGKLRRMWAPAAKGAST